MILQAVMAATVNGPISIGIINSDARLWYLPALYLQGTERQENRGYYVINWGAEDCEMGLHVMFRRGQLQTMESRWYYCIKLSSGYQVELRKINSVKEYPWQRNQQYFSNEEYILI